MTIPTLLLTPRRAALLEWAAVLERYVRAYPDQWLMIQPALCEDVEASR